MLNKTRNDFMGEKIKDKQEGGIEYDLLVSEPDVSMSHVKLKTEDKIPYHKHKETTTHLMKIKGGGKLIIDGVVIPFPKNTMIEPGVPHTYRGIVEFYCVEYPPDTDDFEKVELPDKIKKELGEVL